MIAASGDNRLGGQDFNLVLLEHLVQAIAAKLGGKGAGGVAAAEEKIRADTEAMRALREEAERIKIDLNDEADCSGRFESTDTGVIAVELPAALKAAAPLSVDRPTFERISADLLTRAMKPVQAVLDRVEMKVDEVDELVLVGGSSRMARVRQLLREVPETLNPTLTLTQPQPCPTRIARVRQRLMQFLRATRIPSHSLAAALLRRQPSCADSSPA